MKQTILNDFPFRDLSFKNSFTDSSDWILNKYLYRFYALAVLYLLVIFLLKKWMNSREAFDLRRPLVFWNVFQTGVSLIMFARFLPEVMYVNLKYDFYRSYCRREHIGSATSFWLCVYGISKIFEFTNTGFVVLRKKKLTFLHLFHHFSVYVACVFGLIRRDPLVLYFATMSSFTHALMYTYYALKAAKFLVPRKLAEAVSLIQLVQLIMVTALNSIAGYAKLFGTEPCERSIDISFLYILLGCFNLYLFSDFYAQSYLKKIT